ncbi:MAG TPA: PepSY domain-containing protein [Stellaceae bacterium]|nr:PepSY domain-containing protein [Stellaceae bacterium]
MINRYSAAILLAGILFIGVAGPALGGTKGEAREQTALQGTTLTLSQAIAIAEHQTGGKAYDAGVDVDHGKPRVVVETNGPNGVQTVIIDAQSGQIAAAHAGGVPD